MLAGDWFEPRTLVTCYKHSNSEYLWRTGASSVLTHKKLEPGKQFAATQGTNGHKTVTFTVTSTNLNIFVCCLKRVTLLSNISGRQSEDEVSSGTLLLLKLNSYFLSQLLSTARIHLSALSLGFRASRP